jgi:hypothetical protein
MLARVVSKWVLFGTQSPGRSIVAARIRSAALPWCVGITCRKPVMSFTAASKRPKLGLPAYDSSPIMMAAHCAALIAPVPESVSRSMTMRCDGRRKEVVAGGREQRFALLACRHGDRLDALDAKRLDDRFHGLARGSNDVGEAAPYSHPEGWAEGPPPAREAALGSPCMSQPKDESAYAAAGVNIAAQDEGLRAIKKLARSTFTAGVLSEIGSFGGIFRPDLAGLKEPVLVASADGVGTKLAVARMAGDYSTVGRDLVNHCVNDILVQGARPLFFLDYVGAGVLEPARRWSSSWVA